MRTSSLLRPLLATAALLLLAACQRIDPGPTQPGDTNAQGAVYGYEGKPAPIRTKGTPAGKSSLAPN